MKKSMKFLLLSLLVSSGSLSAANLSKSIALWEQVDQLLCVGQTMNVCSESGCNNVDSGAVWNIDLIHMIIEGVNGNFEIPLVWRNFRYYSSIELSSHVLLLGDGRLMRFNLDNLDSSNRLLTNGIQAAVTSNSWDRNNNSNLESTTTSFECYQQ